MIHKKARFEDMPQYDGVLAQALIDAKKARSEERFEESDVETKGFIEPDWYSSFERLASQGKPVLLIGPPGSGKSFAVEHYCEQQKQKLLVVSCNPCQTSDDIEGRTDLVDGRTVFSLAAPSYAMKHGHGLLLDEADALSAEAAYALYRLLDGRNMNILRQGEDNEVVRHEDFVVFGTQNTEGRGDFRGLYHGRSLQDEAFLDRWTNVIKVDYFDKKIERRIIRSKNSEIVEKDLDLVLEACAKVRAGEQVAHVNASIGVRRSIAVCDNLVRGFSVVESWRFAVLNRLVNEDLLAVSEILQRIYGRNFVAK